MTAAPEPVVLDPERESAPRDLRGEVRAGLASGLVLLIAGPLLGVLWSVGAPSLAVYRVGQPAYLLPAATEDVAVPAGDAIMLGLLLGGGLLVGAMAALCRWRGRRHLPAVVLGLLVGGLLGGALAMAVAHALVHAENARAVAAPEDGTVMQIRPYLRASVDLVALPLGALLAVLAANVVPLLRAAPDPD